jgi:hypothetical protein
MSINTTYDAKKARVKRLIADMKADALKREEIEIFTSAMNRIYAFGRVLNDCPVCLGTGEKINGRCVHCNGTGRVR